MPGENPNRTSLESAMNADQGISGGPMFNDRFQVVGVMDVGTTTGTKGDATPVEDLNRLLSSTQRLHMASNVGSQYGLSLQNDNSVRNYYSAPPVSTAQYGLQSYYPQNARAEMQSRPNSVAVSNGATWADLARMLDR
jgi:hypothetical protein